MGAEREGDAALLNSTAWAKVIVDEDEESEQRHFNKTDIQEACKAFQAKGNVQISVALGIFEHLLEISGDVIKSVGNESSQDIKAFVQFAMVDRRKTLEERISRVTCRSR